jgi:hypothetical protein
LKNICGTLNRQLPKKRKFSSDSEKFIQLLVLYTKIITMTTLNVKTTELSMNNFLHRIFLRSIRAFSSAPHSPKFQSFNYNYCIMFNQRSIHIVSNFARLLYVSRQTTTAVVAVCTCKLRSAREARKK